MDPKEEKRIVDDILNKRRLSYSIEILDVQGDKYAVRNNFGSTITYTKKDDNYLLDSELE
ncbi:MAG: hypothetical protein ACXADU_05065 [Promethearchaeota archaeon]|jgi:hypothetical protein